MDSSSLKQRFVALNSKYVYATSEFKTNVEKLNTFINESQVLTSNLQDLTESFDAFRQIIERFSQEHIREIESLVTFALHSIFYDRDLSLQIEVSDKRSTKSADFFLIENASTSPLKLPLRSSSVAGGILVVIGFVLQVYFISYFKLSPILVTDEAFTQLSSEYLPSFLEFIHRLTLNKEFIVILVSHDTRILEQSDRTYEVNKGQFTLVERESNG